MLPVKKFALSKGAAFMTGNMFSPRILYIVYSVDENNLLFGHQTGLLRALIDNDSTAQVISIYGDSGSVKESVRTHYLDWAPGQTLRNVFKYYALFFRIIVTFRPEKIFVHMADTHCALISPFARLLGIQIYLWYAHKQNSLPFRLSHLFANTIFTSTEDSCPYTSQKIKVVGQAISEEEFFFCPRVQPLTRGVYVGRLDRIKRLDHIIKQIDAGVRLGIIDEFHFYGSPSSDLEKEYFNSMLLDLQTKYPWIQDSFRGPLIRKNIPNVLMDYGFFVNAYLGSLDKVLVEATMMGVPVVTNNLAYASEFDHNSNFFGVELLDQLIAYQNLTPEELKSLLKKRRFIAEEKHSITQWSLKIWEIINESDS
jgi:glycosyltransferase involved in cell wall biosynthesis